MKALCLLFLFMMSLCLAVDTTPQENISLERYLGRWYEQARYENWFEKGMEEVYTDYTQGPDSSINVLNSGKNAHKESEHSTGRAYRVSNGILEVSFVWPYWWFRAPYHILYVDDSYSAALVSGADDQYLWLLTRQKKADKKTIQRLLKEAKLRGFDTTKLRFTKQ